MKANKTSLTCTLSQYLQQLIYCRFDTQFSSLTERSYKEDAGNDLPRINLKKKNL